jgi:periplasmic copper chaperone A
MSMIKKILMVVTAILFAAPVFAGGIEINDAYARSSGKMAKAGGVFMMIHNHTGAEDRLLEVRSDAAKMVQLHTHLKDEDGVMKMRHVPDGFDIPAHGMRSLKRGGDHLMFMGLVAPWEHGGAIQLTLVFENAGEMMIEVPIDLERKDMAHSH